MVFTMNVFRILADLSHGASKCILIWAIHYNKSAEGVSLLTQLLYILVFGTRYLDLFWVAPSKSVWNFVFKIFYITSSAYIVFLMMRMFARTREKEYAWKLAIWSLTGSVASAPLVCLIFRSWSGSTLSEVLWTFSIILESVCILPQLLLLRQTSVPTVLDSYYLVTLGIYRALYILNWIVKGATEGSFDPIAAIFGVVQTAFYVDFAWVYYTRQRVKLRGGGIVDSDDLSKSFIVKRFIGRRGNRTSTEEDDFTDDDTTLVNQENGTVRPSAARSGRTWGARGVSVSADDTLAEHLDASSQDAHMLDPSHFEDDDDDTDAPPPPAKDDKKSSPLTKGSDDATESSVNEWQDNISSSK